MPISMDHRSIILVASCFSRQNASSDTHDEDDTDAPTLQLDPAGGQDHHITMNLIICAVTPLKMAVLPECYQLSENVLYMIA